MERLHNPVNMTDFYNSLINKQVWSEFDFPVLEYARTATGDHYLILWIDCSEKVDRERYLVFKITNDQVNDLNNNKITLRQSILNCLDSDCYIIDVEYIDKDINFVGLKVNPQELPEDYLPTVDSFLN